MKTHGRTQARQGFTRTHRLIGEPTLEVVPPASEWSLQAGVTYNAHRDRFVDASNHVVDVAWADQTTTGMDFVPDSSDVTVSLGVGGIGVFELNKVTVLWEAGRMAQLKAAWGIIIGGTLFRVVNVSVIPLGVPNPYVIKLSLKED